MTRAAASPSEGPDVTTMRRRAFLGGQPRDERHEVLDRPAPERVAGADVHHHDLVAGPNAAAYQPVADRGRYNRISGHLHDVDRSLGRRDVERRQQIPLVLDRVPPAQLARPRDAPRVHPAAAGDLVADPDRRAAQPRQQRRPRSAVEVDGDVVVRGLEPASQRDVGHHAAQSSRARSDDDVVEMRVVKDDRRGRRFDDVGEVGVGKPPAQRVDRRRREDHVANLPETNEQDSGKCVNGEFRMKHSQLITNYQLTISDCRFVDQHHRNVVFDRIDALAGGALERRAVLDERHRRLAVGAGENLEQFWIDRHGGNI